MGVDDYLAQGHTLDDLIALEVLDEAVGPSPAFKPGGMYCVENGQLCWVKQSQDGETVIPLCNFNARIVEEITRDNGVESSGAFRIEGTDMHGKPLPTIEVSLAAFESMSWVVTSWGRRGILSANQTTKAKVREAMMLQSQDAKDRTIYSHTGWRMIGGKPVFLTASGALGMPDIDVEVEEDLSNYALPDSSDDPTEALKASYEFLGIGNPDITIPLWATMYLSPLTETLNPAFTLFLVGHSGSFKSTVSALALNHFGEKFDEFHLPAAWRDTQNRLEKLLFLAKDLPLVIDDWAPGTDSAKARELEAKAEHVIRAQANRQGRGRLRSDTSSRKTYIPRGILITSGEQLPGGHSHTARIFSVEIQTGDVSREKLTEAQRKRHLYPHAMSAYIRFLQSNWDEVRQVLPAQYEVWRDQAREASQHPRLPGTVAWLYAGLSTGLDCLLEHGVISSTELDELTREGWEVFLRLSAEQAVRVEEQRPGRRFTGVLGSLIAQGRAVLWDKGDDEPRRPAPGETMVGWTDGDAHVLLQADAAYAAVRQFCQNTDQPFTFKANAVWKDLHQLGYATGDKGRNTYTVRIYGRARRVIRVERTALQIPVLPGDEEDAAA